MRGVKCFGLLLVFSIIFGLSLSASSDVSALKYAYDAIPLSTDVYYFDSISRTIRGFPGFSVSLSSGNDSLSFNSTLLDINSASFDTCNNSQPINSHQNIFRSSFYSSKSILSSGTYFSKLRYPSTSTCIGDSNDAFPSSRWSYDHIYTAKYNLSNGDVIDVLDIPRFLFPEGQDGYSSSSIYSMSLPLELDPDKFPVISSGTLLEWDFGFTSYNMDSLSFDSNFSPVMDISYFTADPSVSSESELYNSYRSTVAVDHPLSRPTCTVDFDYQFIIERPTIRDNLRGLNIHCSYTAPSDLYFASARLDLHGSNSSTPFLTWSNGDLIFSGAFFTTGGDSTWSGMTANSAVTGDQMDSNPSYNQFYGYIGGSCSDSDWFCKITKSFGFSFINPFAPIFNLFSDQNSCAQIPTLAGMLHSEETQVCPWFDSTTRNIVTPVLGLSSMMLLFGFAVRWLGSRSGNFIEDADGFDSGGLHFQNKFRRK